MSRFTTPLRIEDTGVTRKGRQIFRLLESFDYEVGGEGSTFWIRVPAGFETDFSSSPRILWWFMAPTGKHGKAAVLHDFMYRKSSGFGKEVGDTIFYEAMKLLGVGWWTRTSAYWIVSYFGHWAYNWEKESPPHTATAMLEPVTGELKPHFGPQETFIA